MNVNDEEVMKIFKNNLVNRIFKLLPEREEECEYWQDNLEDIIVDLKGIMTVYDKMDDRVSACHSLIIKLNGIKDVKFEVFRRNIFSAITLVKKI